MFNKTIVKNKRNKRKELEEKNKRVRVKEN